MSLAKFRIRTAIADDLVAVIGLERAAVEAPHWAVTDYEEIVTVQSGGIRRCLLIAETLSDGIIGFAVGKVIGLGDIAELESVAVDAAARRGGVGRALCQAVAEWCCIEGAEELELEVRAASAGAIALYAGLGFVVEGRRTAYYQTPMDDALLMRMGLVEHK